MSSPNPETPSDSPADPAPKPTRRTFTTEYRNRILGEYNNAPHGEKSAVLRREGLYQSQLREWAQARTAAAGKSRPKAAANPDTDAATRKEMARLTRENARLAKAIDADGGRARDHGKTSRALGIHLREQGHTALTEDALNSTFTDLRAAEIPTRRSCILIGRARATPTVTSNHPFKVPGNRDPSRTTAKRSPHPSERKF
ncbi:hypothetical protein PXH69_34585 [Rhodococcus qingshengii]|uniref:Transposase n=1 Tax=Rhodococcus qingshengii TaxID=334542 RepID=A0AAW6LYR2_RHOSG|nr:hypothetical protein [Rhodococcus qingshengii]MDE8650085.1 hypothetical protein [Rhodococcus qingshengii]